MAGLFSTLFLIAVVAWGAGARHLLSVDAGEMPCKGRALLPDLVATVPTKLAVVPAQSGSSRFLLIFATRVYNAGEGPLRLVGQRASWAQTELSVRQVVVCAGGGHEIIKLAGAMRYENEPTHRHWHYLGFERYTLTGLSARTPTRRSRKQGFCLVDELRVLQGARGRAG